MAENLENKTLNGKLIKKGFDVRAVITYQDLPEVLAKLGIELAKESIVI